MNDFINKLYTDKKSLYTLYKIKKSNGKYREISAPCDELKNIQKQIADSLVERFDHLLDDSVIGFRKDQSILTNASHHLNKNIVINVDIKDFFPSIPTWWIFKFIFMEFVKGGEKFNGFSQEDVYQICTLDNKLCQGSPASPILANLYVGYNNGIDRYFKEMCQLSGWDYTRYADDLTFSTNLSVRRIDIYWHFLSTIYAKLREFNLEPSIKKTKVKYKSQKQKVTGIIVNNSIPSISKKLRNNMRAILHNSIKENKVLDDQSRGILSFVKSVNKNQCDALVRRIK